MTDRELADDIERHLAEYPAPCPVIGMFPERWQQIIAALRRADLAQTEIKGHMRVEDDLQIELSRALYNFDDAHRKLAEAQVRIAELEKVLTWCADHSGECLGDHMQRLNLIRALLKSRA